MTNNDGMTNKRRSKRRGWRMAIKARVGDEFEMYSTTSEPRFARILASLKERGATWVWVTDDRGWTVDEWGTFDEAWNRPGVQE